MAAAQNIRTQNINTNKECFELADRSPLPSDVRQYDLMN